jgi:hypothetical protein
MSNVQWKLVEGAAGSVVSVFVDGEIQIADSTQPNFDAIVAACRNDVVPAANLFSLVSAVTERFEPVSERVSVLAGRVFFDGDEIDNALTQQIVRLLNADEDFEPLVLFLEKLATNPDENSKTQLYTWLTGRKFTITDDGDFLAYKGVNRIDGKLVSSHAGKAIVDGVPVNGQVPNEPGSVVEMPRSEVTNDPSLGCHIGLHAGTYDFASRFTSGPTVVLRVNPRDVVSVPKDSSQQKLRVCRYVVEKVIDEEFSGLVYTGDDDDLYDELDDDDYDEYTVSTTDTPAPNTINVGATGPHLSFRSGRGAYSSNVASVNSQAKLNWQDVENIRKRHEAGYSTDSLADDYGVSRRAVQRIVNRQSWV